MIGGRVRSLAGLLSDLPADRMSASDVTSRRLDARGQTSVTGGRQPHEYRRHSLAESY